ncbi:MAG: Foldase protein PrsA 1 precursor [Syntrophaceae bacterium PtaB.Bin095]|jgi:peptidyl-prolyl cis-trans isomerase C|nr:MAG: Foldase protein PrsA 1 precursor [Syntrophaceae bacterium PtaB.Bin095]
MTTRKATCFILLAAGLIFGLFTGCTPKEEKASAPAPQTDSTPAAPSAAPTQTPDPAAVLPAVPTNLIAEVDGKKLTQGQLDAEVQKRLTQLKDQIPADRLQQVKERVRKQMIDDFVIRMLLTDELNRRKITVTEQEVGEAVERLKNSLPQNMTLEELMRKNQVNREQMNEQIRFGLQINKLVLATAEGKAKPTEKEISAFYQKNKAKLKVPESIRVRHILVGKKPEDDDKARAEKRDKAENIRKQILGGADFAEVARNQSDCPSKQAGGDLGTFVRGQMVKPFEDAAFSQKKDEIGPVVETDFGYHIIQVLEKNSSRTLKLDDETKGRISAVLTQQKQQKAFDTLLQNLRAKARVVYYEK